MIVAAILRRELLSMLRRKGAFLLLLLFVVACFITSWSTMDGTRAIGFVDLGLLAQLSSSWVSALVKALVIGALLVIPGVAGSAITVEREQETYDQLVLTGASPWSILVGKLASSTVVFLLAIIAILPIAAVALFLPGVDIYDFLYQMLCLMLLVVVMGAFGLLCSVLIRRSFAAILAAYATCAMAAAGSAFLFAQILNAFGLGVPDALAAAAPVLAVLEPNTNPNPLWVAIAADIALIAIPLSLARWYFQQASQKTAITAPVIIDDVSSLERRRKKFPYYLFDPAKRRDMLVDNVNPMFQREMRWGLFGRAHIIIRVAYLSLFSGIISAVLLINFDPNIASDFSRMVRLLALVNIVLTTLIIPALVCNVLTKEREMGNLDMLRSTLLRPWDIVFGKWLACCASVVPFLVPLLTANLLVMAASMFADGRGIGYFCIGAAWLIVAALVTVSLALLGSAWTNRTATAVVLSYFLVLALHVGLPLAISAVILSFSDNQDLATVPLVLLSPLFTCLASLHIEFFAVASTFVSSVLLLGTLVHGATIALALALANRAYARRGTMG